jgi:hypothetical protein
MGETYGGISYCASRSPVTDHVCVWVEFWMVLYGANIEVVNVNATTWFQSNNGIDYFMK